MTDTTMAPDRLAEAKRRLLEKRLRGEVKPAPAGRIGKAPGGPAYPMSYQQEQLWFLDQLEPGSPFYNIPGAHLVSARIDADALERALGEIVRRHEGLRTVFRSVDGRPMQVVVPPHPVRVEREDLRGPNGEPAPAELLRQKASEWGSIPFDLTTGPLLRWKMYRVSEADCLLVFNLHHIVTDGWSMPVVTRELEELYEAFAAGLPSPLPEIEVQYADYSVWQREYLTGATLERQLDHWRRHLAGAPAVMELPYDRPRPAVKRHHGTMYRVAWPGALTERLRTVGRAEGASVNMVFMAGFTLLLQRYGAGDDLVVGTLLGNRNRAELEQVVGYLVNSGAIRTRLRGDPTFREVVRQVRTSVLDADANQEVPFDLVVDALKPPRDPGRNPLFQVMYFHHTFVQGHHLAEEEGMGGSLNLRSLYQETGIDLVDTGAAKFDMTWATLEAHDALSVTVEYDTDLFDEATIARMERHLEALLGDACAHPDVPISSLSMVAPAERTALEVFARPAAAFDAGAALHERFAARAAAAPDAVAVTCEGASLTYAELDARANRLAHHLAALGVASGDLVGLFLERSPELVAGILAILKAGAAYLPLDPAWPAQRIAETLEDSGARVVVSTESLAGRIGGDGVRVVAVDRDAAEIAARPATAPAVRVDGEARAYVIYTSGSTGRPKGVEVTHANVARLFAATDALFGFGAEDVWTLFHSFAFDFSVWELWGALLHGGRLVVVPYEVSRAPATFLELLARERVTVLNQTPSAFRALMAEDEALSPELALRWVIFGGEALDPRSLRGWVERRGDDRPVLVNMYGITETTVHVTWRVIRRADVEACGGSPIGVPIDDLSVQVLDPQGHSVPVGVPGEMVVGGAGVARGYLRRPALTAERFVPDPGGAPGSRRYRSGDRARRLPGGELEYLGRLDQQVKVRGFRIEPGEVEAALRRTFAVRDAVVDAVAEGGGDARLVAWIVPDGPEPTAAELRAHLREHLPEHMVPAVFVPVAAIPMNANGKVDRRALPSPDAARLEAGAGYAAPATGVEAALAAIWAEVLRVDRVGVHDNFFSLGGDSILSIQLIARANEAGLRLTPRHVLMHQTVAELAAVAGRAKAPVAEQGAVTGEAPLTPVQHWYFEHESPEPHHHNLAMQFQARRPIDAAALEHACAALLAHHDALRLRFERGADGWRQANAGPSPETPFEVIDIAAEPEREAAFTARAAAVQRSLHLARGPLVRFALFRMGDAPDRLLIAAHHLVMDAVSMPIVAGDLETAYAQAAAGSEIHLPKKTTSFRHWALRLAEYARSGEVRAQTPFWLAQRDVAALPADGAGANTEGEAAHVSVALDAEATHALLHDVPGVYQTHVNDVLLAALARAFRGWTGERALLVDLEGHGREDLFDDVDLSRTVGWFTAIYPVRLELPADGGEGAAIKAVKEQLRAVPGKGLSYGLLRWLSGDREISAALRALPRAQVAFNYLGRMELAPDDGDGAFAELDADVGPGRSPLAPRPHQLLVDAVVIGGRLEATWTYAPAIHREETVRRLAEAFVAELRALIEHCLHPEAGGFTPSDFDLAQLDQGALDAVLSQVGG